MSNSLIQGTKEWHELRRTKIGASDAAVIMGVSPWMTKMELWEEKMGFRTRPQTNPAMERGNALEPIARQAYIDLTGVEVVPVVVFHPEHEWMMASLDGLSSDGTVVEIKVPGLNDHALAAKGRIPLKYYPQLQHQMAVTGAKRIHYFSFNEESQYLIELDRDDGYIQDMIEKEQDFYNMLQEMVVPEPSYKDVLSRDDDDWKSLTEQLKAADKVYKKAEKASKEAKKDVDKIIDSLKQLAKDRSCNGNHVKFTVFPYPGKIVYEKIPELEGVNLDAYREPSTLRYKYTIESY